MPGPRKNDFTRVYPRLFIMKTGKCRKERSLYANESIAPPFEFVRVYIEVLTLFDWSKHILTTVFYRSIILFLSTLASTLTGSL